MYRSTAALVAIFFSSGALASQICSPSTCIDGSASSPLLSYDQTSSQYLVPGSYNGRENANISPLHNTTVSTSPSGLLISPPPHPISFSRPIYSGNAQIGSPAGIQEGWSSLYLPQGWYAILSPGRALWNSVPDAGLLPSGLGGQKITKAASAACTQPCASHGTCLPSSNSTAVCACDQGWAGPTCDQCAQGYFGPTCTPCQENCTACDDGLTGTGLCIGASVNPMTQCNCAYGSCTPNGDCTCAAGYLTNSSSPVKCSSCAPGFFKDANANCLACPLGCTSCTLQPGTTNTPSCTSCSSGLSLSNAIPPTCRATQGSCPAGSYFSSTGSCQSCSPACSTCTGPTASECLACAMPRANLNGNCVGVDALGVCDSSLSALPGMFVLNNAKQRCESCPAGCSSCSIPSFSPAAAYDTVRCTACQEAYLVQDGKCLKTCTEGWYLPSGSSNSTCQRCDSTCSKCVGSATFCTRCISGFASLGTCGASCPSNTIYSNGTCDTCHPECATCSQPGSATHCSSCPSTRPILTNGQCLDHCPKTSFFEVSSNSCRDCDKSCGSCSDSGDSSCTSCPDGSVLKSGKCISTTCAFAPGLGVCLEAFVIRPNNARWAAFVILPALLMGLGAWWYVRRERQKTREESKAFATAMDNYNIRKRTARMRLERVFGLERVHIDPEEGDVGAERRQKEKKRLRELLLPSKNRRQVLRDSIELSQSVKKDQELRQSTWMAPPPPYAPPEQASTTGGPPTLITPAPGMGESRTQIISLGSPSSPVTALGGLRPPPRPTVRVPLERQSSVIRASASRSGHDLSELWPAMIQRDEVDLLSSDGDWSGRTSRQEGRWNHGHI